MSNSPAISAAVARFRRSGRALAPRSGAQSRRATALTQPAIFLFSSSPLSISSRPYPFSSAPFAETHFIFHPARGRGAPTGARVPARHPDLRAMTGARRLVRDARVSRSTETLASRRSTWRFCGPCPCFPLSGIPCGGRTATLFAARVIFPQDRVSWTSTRYGVCAGRGRHLPRSTSRTPHEAPLDERGWVECNAIPFCSQVRYSI